MKRSTPWLERLQQKLITTFLPATQLYTTPWLDQWNDEVNRRYTSVALYGFVFALGAYAAHIPLAIHVQLHPLHRILRCYGVLCGCALLAWNLVYWGSGRPLFTRLLLFSYIFALSLIQAKITVWDSKVHFLFCTVLPLLAVIPLPLNPLSALFFLSLLLIGQWGIERSLSYEVRTHLISLDILALGMLFAFKSHMRVDVENFLNYHTTLATQKKLIEVQQELNQQIRAFLPGEIYHRFMQNLRDKQLPMNVAIEEVLKPHYKEGVCCLYSDVRGFTESLKSGEERRAKDLLLDIRKCTDIVELHRGIPRLIGDLVFTYFDGEPSDNLLHSVQAAFELVDETLHARPSLHISRYCLLSRGPALVGNVGGRDSSREITALGTVVNILSRIDEVTKEKRFQLAYPPGSILMTSEYVSALRKLPQQLEVHSISLPDFGIRIRNFPEEKMIWHLPTHELNREALWGVTPFLKAVGA